MQTAVRSKAATPAGRPRSAVACKAAVPRAPPAAAWAAAALILTSAGPALAAGDVTIGAKVFSNTCAACHAGGQNIVEADKTLEKEALEQYLDGGFNEAAIIRQVTNGKGAMPAWGGQLSKEEIEGVAAYVYKTASEGGW